MSLLDLSCRSWTVLKLDKEAIEIGIAVGGFGLIWWNTLHYIVSSNPVLMQLRFSYTWVFWTELYYGQFWIEVLKKSFWIVQFMVKKKWNQLRNKEKAFNWIYLVSNSLLSWVDNDIIFWNGKRLIFVMQIKLFYPAWKKKCLPTSVRKLEQPPKLSILFYYFFPSKFFWNLLKQ